MVCFFVYFGMLSWCGPCRILSPVLEKVTSDVSFSNGNEVDLITINTDEESALAQKYKVRSLSSRLHPTKIIHIPFQVTALPTVIAFRDGKPIEQFIGAQPTPVVQEWIRRLSS
jgi:thioredoxin 1